MQHFFPSLESTTGASKFHTRPAADAVSIQAPSKASKPAAFKRVDLTPRSFHVYALAKAAAKPVSKPVAP